MSELQTSPLGWPAPQGLWHPSQEKDGCGVGFIAHLKGKRSHDIIEKTLLMNSHMDHRGASGADPATGDGAGIFVQMPDKFLRKELSKQRIELPPEGEYASGLVFLSPEPSVREAAIMISFLPSANRRSAAAKTSIEATMSALISATHSPLFSGCSINSAYTVG